jgi:hypothetical protein
MPGNVLLWKTVLLVDDLDLMRKMIRNFLESWAWKYLRPPMQRRRFKSAPILE